MYLEYQISKNGRYKIRAYRLNIRHSRPEKAEEQEVQ
jgi:hypothetical protein